MSDLAIHPLDRSTRMHADDPDVSSGQRTATVSVAGRVLDWRQAAGGGLVALGAIGIVVAWFQIAGTSDVWKQLPYLASGGVGGAALIAVGITLFVAYEHASDRVALEQLLLRFDSLEARLDGSPPAARPRSPERDELLERLATLEAALAALQDGPKRAKAASTRTTTGRRRG